MSLAAWFRRWNSHEARQKRKKARHEAWAQAAREVDAKQGSRGPVHTQIYRRHRGLSDWSDNDAGAPQD